VIHRVLAGLAAGALFVLCLASRSDAQMPRVGLELAGSTTASSVGGGATPEGGRPAVPARVNVGTAELLFRSRAMAIGRECGSVPVRQRFDTAESRTRSSGSR
jgi:hypothetical protein